jgi:acyl dehydratase
MRVKYFEDFEVGSAERFEGEYVLSRDEIVEVGRRWDPQPFHVDEEAARSSIFGGLVAASAHLFAVSSWMATRMPYRTAALAALGFDEVRMQNPARVGDRLSATATCIEKRLSRSKPDRGIVRSLMQIRNQRDEVVMSLQSTFLVACRPDPPEREC